MIFGAHVIVYSEDAAADRDFFRDVLGFSHVDAGHDWLIFALPPAELAVHPAEENIGHELYFMCDEHRRWSPHRTDPQPLLNSPESNLVGPAGFEPPTLEL